MGKNPIILIFTFLGLVGCIGNKEDLPVSDKFYKEYRFDFLKSDLTKYAYNPREQFTKQEYDQFFFRVLVLQDSTILVFGIKQFNKEFNLTIDTTFGSDVIISNQLNGDLLLYSSQKNIKSKQEIKKANFSVNPVIYFQKLLQQIRTYNIIAIEKHPCVNTIELVFSDHDYLIYKPDKLVFHTDNKDFMKYLFKENIELDNNWYQFKTVKDIDYY